MRYSLTRLLNVPQPGHAASRRPTRTDTSNPPAAVSTAPVTSKSSKPDSTRVTSPISGPPSLDSAYCQTREAPTRARGPSHHKGCPINRVEPVYRRPKNQWGATPADPMLDALTVRGGVEIDFGHSISKEGVGRTAATRGGADPAWRWPRARPAARLTAVLGALSRAPRVA